MDSKATLRSLILSKSRNRGELRNGSSARTFGSTQFSSAQNSTTSFGTFGTGFSATTASGITAPLTPRPPAGTGGRVQPLTGGSSSARSYMERAPPYQFPRVSASLRTNSGPGKTPQYAQPAATAVVLSTAHSRRPQPSSARTTRAQQALEAAGLPSLESLQRQRREAVNLANAANAATGAGKYSSGFGSSVGSPRAGGGWAGRSDLAGGGGTVSGGASSQQNLPPNRVVPDSVIAAGLGNLNLARGGTPKSGRTGLKSGDSVFKYKRLPISPAKYETLMDEKLTPKIRRSRVAGAILKDDLNLHDCVERAAKLAS